jgi:DNA-binding NtrC family response regulator
MTDPKPSRPLRILFVEDSADDLALLVRNLRKAGFDPSWAQVEDEDSFREALLSREWDVVLADYSLPHYNAAEAIVHLRQVQPYLPMIVVSGNVGEETAVAVVKAGAGDYVMKDSLARLAPAIDREIREAQKRRERDRNRDQSQQHALLAFAAAPAALLLLDEDGNVLTFNRQASVLLDGSDEEIYGASMSDLVGLQWTGESTESTGALASGNPVRVLCVRAGPGAFCCLLEELPGQN